MGLSIWPYNDTAAGAEKHGAPIIGKEGSTGTCHASSRFDHAIYRLSGLWAKNPSLESAASNRHAFVLLDSLEYRQFDGWRVLSQAPIVLRLEETDHVAVWAAY